MAQQVRGNNDVDTRRRDQPTSGGLNPAGYGSGGGVQPTGDPAEGTPNPNYVPFLGGGNRANVAAGSTFQDQARARQQALIDQLHGIATGRIKSPAMEQFEQQVQQAQNQSQGTSASLRDVGPGGQMQLAQQNQGNIQAQGIQNGAILQTQQQQQAEQALASLYEQQRNGDLGQADVNAQGTLGNNALNDMYGMNQFGLQYGIDTRNTQQAQDLARAKLGFGSADSQSSENKVGSALGAAGSLFGYLSNAGSGSQNSKIAADASGNRGGYADLSSLYGDK